jgi:protein transport protein SEC61 subunit gamma-like protein
MEEEFKPDWKFKTRRFFKECMRVFRVTKKPSMMEFKTIVKASGLGMIIIGFVGFLISMIKQLLF